MIRYEDAYVNKEQLMKFLNTNGIYQGKPEIRILNENNYTPDSYS